MKLINPPNPRKKKPNKIFEHRKFYGFCGLAMISSNIEKALRLGAADLSGLEAQSTSHEYEALRETIPKRHRTTSIRKGSEQSMNESRIQE